MGTNYDFSKMLVHFSVGIEDSEDLVEDINRALASV